MSKELHQVSYVSGGGLAEPLPNTDLTSDAGNATTDVRGRPVGGKRRGQAPAVSVICLYNNASLLERYLLRSLSKQTIPYEWIGLDDTEGTFSSAAAALNLGASQANGEYLMFVHQDVDLLSNSWLHDAVTILRSIPDLGIAGVAGVTTTGRTPAERGRNNITHGDPPGNVAGKRIEQPEKVQTLDGCLVIIPAAMFASQPFDEHTCSGWYLYAADYCLGMPNRVYVLPLSIHHVSKGPMTAWGVRRLLLGPRPLVYYQSLRKILRKHRRRYRHIYTTCGDWNTSTPLVMQRLIYLAIKGMTLVMTRLRKVFMHDLCS